MMYWDQATEGLSEDRMTRPGAILAATLGTLAALFAASGSAGAATIEAGAPSAFGADSARITNPYLPISSFSRCVLAGYDTGEHLRVVRRLEPRARSVAYGDRKVRVSAVSDRVTNLRTGELIEKTIDLFAQDIARNAYYFGEKVNEYRNGTVINHSGSWQVGRDGAGPGLLMPAHPKVGDVFFSENVAGVAVERDRVIASGIRKSVDGHLYHDVIRIHEHATTPKPAEVELKTYAPGIGVITEADGELHLVGCS